MLAAASSIFVLALFVAPGASVRLNDAPVVSDSGSESEGRLKEIRQRVAPLSSASSSSSLVAHESNQERLDPGADRDHDCCCTESPCTWKEMQGTSQAVTRLLNRSIFDPEQDQFVHSCCHNVSKRGWFRCRGGTILEDAGVCDYQEPLVASVELCQDWLTWWFLREDWYKLLPDYSSGITRSRAQERKYTSYVPCLTEKSVHVNDIVIGTANYFATEGWANPIRTWIVRQPECAALSKGKLMQALEQSYDEMCPFPLKDSAYSPNFQPERACTINKTNSMIHYSDVTRCPEGHRCACPMFRREMIDSLQKDEWESWQHPGPTSIFKMLSDAIGSQGSWVDAGRTVSQISVLSGIGTLLFHGAISIAGWQLYLITTGAGLLVYGNSMYAQYSSYSCEAKVGCYPMDCVHEEDVGCRINLDTDGSEQRNPYWFLPPPMYKCSVNPWGRCKLMMCGAQEAREQMIGESTIEFGIFKRGRRSVLHNCQPMLSADMSTDQRRDLEHKVTSVRSHESMIQRRRAILLEQLEEFCPHLSPTPYVTSALCMDMTWCEWIEAPNCCVNSGGVKKCPMNFPKLCADGSCDAEMDSCSERGDVKECPVENQCPYVVPRIEDNKVECRNGDIMNTSLFNDTAPWCADQGGLRTCPWNLPTMCNDLACLGEHCCAKDCAEHGGPLACVDLLIEPLDDSAVMSHCQLWFQLLLVAVPVLNLGVAWPLR